ncbi:hypothetical protein B0A48_18314 [Cryoendolithus antarcticus]|uniref:Uncharacterized protein n=1 Tax=Cryoendolithus antarcticus TaxID=1507870 RepID=A0A1V8S992_9PEZI|nr:hypothetical protein B0A48_18314 [Cryoendolithus antarcticus]
MVRQHTQPTRNLTSSSTRSLAPGTLLKGSTLHTSLLAGSVSTGSTAAGSLCTGCITTGSSISGSLCTGSIITGSIVIGSVITGAVVVGSVIIGGVVVGSIATGSVVVGAGITGAVTVGSLLGGRVVSGSVIVGSVLFGGGMEKGVGKVRVGKADVKRVEIEKARGELRRLRGRVGRRARKAWECVQMQAGELGVGGVGNGVVPGAFEKYEAVEVSDRLRAEDDTPIKMESVAVDDETTTNPKGDETGKHEATDDDLKLADPMSIVDPI